MPTPPPADQPPPPSSAAALFDLLGRRWALRVLWELRDAPLSFLALQRQCDSMSTSVLSQRLAELRSAGLVEKDEAGVYALSAQGRTLLDRLRWVDEWTRHWTATLGTTSRPRDRS